MCLVDFSLGLERGEGQPPADVATAARTSDAVEQQRAEDNDADEQEGAGADDGYPQMTEKQKKLFELRLKMVWRIADFTSHIPTVGAVATLFGILIHGKIGCVASKDRDLHIIPLKVCAP